MAGVTYTAAEMVGKLVAFNTTSHRSNLDLIQFCAEYLAGHGVEAALIHNPEGTKANLVATIGPGVAGGVMLSGHTDVVPVEGQDWESDPFEVMERDGRLHGRGTADMKSFLAVALTLVPEFAKRDLKVPIHLAFSYDEEVGCFGAVPLLEHVTAHLPPPLAVIIGEPTDMKVVNAHRGIAIYRTTVSGRPGHASATHKGVSAVVYAAECVAFLGRLTEEIKAGAAPIDDFDPPYTTINVGRIKGGSAVNVIAPGCVFDWESRVLPGGDGDEAARRLAAFAADELLPRMHAVAPEAEIVTEEVVALPAFIPEPGSPAEALVLMLTGQNRARPVQFSSEAGLFQGSGLATVICGPGHPDQAHRANEYVTLADIEACQALLRKLADWAESV
ncbi:MAG: acetylornithine deacetylase [Rhodospirillales bacterium]|jgi:acetylornithine deacetylase|nr:acetylornithine deacetylase [Rhodospirillales bacterium]MDP6774240.1 acetylornithine deacetylase [Rhodospirillales bacterium]